MTVPRERVALPPAVSGDRAGARAARRRELLRRWSRRSVWEWARPRLRSRDTLIVAATTLLGVVHLGVVAVTYHIGSFDDDASYIMAARALAHGHGLTSTLLAGLPMVSAYPPGYPLLLAPLVAIWGIAAAPLRLLSGAFFVAVFPLTWHFLRRRGISRPVATAVLLLLALNPVLATYGTMVMAELPFVVALLVTVIVLERWQGQQRVVTVTGLFAVAMVAELVWLKQAGIGMAIGAILWLAFRRQTRKALLTTAGLAALLAPLLIARALTSTPLLGSRYSSDLGAADGSTFVHRLTHVPGQALSLYYYTAVPRSIVPTWVSPLPRSGALGTLIDIFRLSLAPLVILGAIVWINRLRRRDAASWLVWIYFVETLVYPYTNERRVILVLPVVLTWLVLGAQAVPRLAGTVGRRLGGGRLRSARPAFQTAGALTAMAGVVVMLAFQFPRNYQLPVGRSTSEPRSSTAMALLRELGTPSDVVETDYVWTTSLFSDHRTRKGFYESCTDGVARRLALQDQAVYVLTSGFAFMGIGSPCGIQIASRVPWAVRLYRTVRDQTAVFALVGPGTMRPAERDLTAGQRATGSSTVEWLPEPVQGQENPGMYPTVRATRGQATLTWAFPSAAVVRQVSVGGVNARSISGVAVQLREGNRWVTVLHATGPVGAGEPVPFLLAPSLSREATGLRVVVTGQGTVAFHDVHALGELAGSHGNEP